MDHLDRLTSSYAAMSEDKLAKAASNAYALTDEAQQILREEILTRGLNIELNSRAPKPDIGDEEDGDSGLVVVASLRSRNDAAKIQAVLNAAAVRSCLGSDNVENIESFTGAFDKPVDLKVYFPYAGKASRLIYQLQNSNPPELEKDVEVEDDE